MSFDGAATYFLGEDPVYIEGKPLTEEQFNERVGKKKYPIDYRNASGQYHRYEGPAYTGATGYRGWWLHGKRHCTSGPALIRVNGNKEWWIEGKKLTEAEWKVKVKNYA